MLKKICLFSLVVLSVLAILSCAGGSSNPVSPDNDNGPYRVLGENMVKPLPSVIAFTRDLPTPDSVYPYNREIFIMGPNGHHQRRITKNNADDDYPALSPWGHGLAFVSNRSSGGYGAHDIFRIDPAGHVVQLTDDSWQWDAHGTDWDRGYITAARINQLTGAPFDVGQVIKLDPWGRWEDYINTGFMAVYAPAIGRGPHSLVFGARPPSGWYWGSIEIYMLSDTADGPIRLTHFAPDPDDPYNMVFSTNPQFNRRGDKVIFQTTYWGNSEIAYIDLANDVDTFTVKRLTENESMDVEPCWDPTGQWFCWASDRDGNYELYKQRLYDPASPTPIPPIHRLTFTEEDEHNPDWAPLMWLSPRNSLD